MNTALNLFVSWCIWLGISRVVSLVWRAYQSYRHQREIIKTLNSFQDSIESRIKMHRRAGKIISEVLGK